MSTQSKGQEGPESTQHKPKQNPKSHELLNLTIKSPPFSYAHLEVRRDEPGHSPTDTLQFKSYLTAALTQFLGSTGAAISVDILKVDNDECWVRVPRPDLGAFAAAITAWPGVKDQGVHNMLRLRQASDWLGSMVGSDGQERLWNS